MTSSSMKLAVVVCFALALLSIAAPTPITRDGEANIPGWQSIYGVGPVVQSKAIEGEAPGIPGWHPIYGHGPIVPSHFNGREVDAPVPRPTKYAIDYLPNKGQGNVDDASPAPTTTAKKPNPSKYAVDYLPGYPVTTAPKPNPSKYAIDYLPGYGSRPSSPTTVDDNANLPKPTKSSKYAIDYMPTWAVPAPKETSV
ncbi:hypothetical protein PC9H_000222 [Pleurotus ostreatus]|uniref:Uncharacterized protein n=1 Tax=Pleurotus ostreatus TaxID=5322 RepID=A0A8H7A0P5_PLEOS|nr:uncharacterized protein PC9H_000222 [Pleurotus ostreatus]KAF7439885.1 hypothetical protein PC9H_000222 [Pleurotus ostreatus]KAJ8700927.1 hypothetical protein PTI98_003904 [Pleurotus ostreatus]